MAKQLVNPIERHVEKAVLGVTGLLLLGVIGKFVISSPNQMELGGEFVSPKAVDQKVAQLAASVRQDIKNAPAAVELPQPLYEEWLASLDPFQQENVRTTLPTAAPIGPEVPIVDEATKNWNATLPDVFAFTQSGVTYGRSTFVTQTRDGRQRYHPTNWVTVSGVFDIKKEMREQRSVCGATRKEVIFGPPELQRRARRLDGSWSEDDWQDVKPWFTPELPTRPKIGLIEDEGRIVVSDEDLEDVHRFSNELSHPALQLDLIRPLLPEMANGDEWTFPILTDRRDVLFQDEFYLYPDDPRSSNPADRYGQDTGTAERKEKALSPEEQRAKDLAEVERLLDEAWKTKNPNPAIIAHNLAAAIKEDKSTPAKDVEKATRLKERANQMIADIDRIKVYGGGGTAPRGPVREEAAEEVVRQPEPIQQIWVHDAAPGSVEGGHAYQYRIRAVIFNRLAGYAERLRNATDATVLWIPGPWGDPVEVYIEPATVLFAASKDERNNEIGIEFYKWVEGVWCKAREKFGVGDTLSFSERCEVPSLTDPTKTDRAMVGFDTGLSVVDIDFDRPYRERKKGSSREGVKFGSATTACSIVLADAQGRLHERFLATDKANPAKRQYAAREFKPAKSGD